MMDRTILEDWICLYFLDASLNLSQEVSLAMGSLDIFLVPD